MPTQRPVHSGKLSHLVLDIRVSIIHGHQKISHFTAVTSVLKAVKQVQFHGFHPILP